MSRKKYANFYTDRKYKRLNHNLVKVVKENNTYDVKNIEEELNKKENGIKVLINKCIIRY